MNDNNGDLIFNSRTACAKLTILQMQHVENRRKKPNYPNRSAASMSMNRNHTTPSGILCSTGLLSMCCNCTCCIRFLLLESNDNFFFGLHQNAAHTLPNSFCTLGVTLSLSRSPASSIISSTSNSLLRRTNWLTKIWLTEAKKLYLNWTELDGFTLTSWNTCFCPYARAFSLCAQKNEIHKHANVNAYAFYITKNHLYAGLCCSWCLCVCVCLLSTKLNRTNAPALFAEIWKTAKKNRRKPTTRHRIAKIEWKLFAQPFIVRISNEL